MRPSGYCAHSVVRVPKNSRFFETEQILGSLKAGTKVNSYLKRFHAKIPNGTVLNATKTSLSFFQRHPRKPHKFNKSSKHSGLSRVRPGVQGPVQVRGEGQLAWSLGRSGPNLAGVLPTWGHSHREVLDQLTPYSWPDSSGKCARAPKRLLPGKIPEQLKFVMGISPYFSNHNFISLEMAT